MRPTESKLNTLFASWRIIVGTGSPVMTSRFRMPFICAPMSADRTAMIFRSRQQICGITVMPVSRPTLRPVRIESARVRPLGESGSVITSTGRRRRPFAASMSFRSSARYGGASSTAIYFEQVPRLWAAAWFSSEKKLPSCFSPALFPASSGTGK